MINPQFQSPGMSPFARQEPLLSADNWNQKRAYQMAKHSFTLPLDQSLVIESRIAATRLEMTQAFRLTYQSYVQSNLIERNRFQMRVSPYHLLPTSHVFIAVVRSATRHEVVCTLSLIGDGELGLPLECCYQDEVASLRNHGLRIAEVSCLAFACRHSVRASGVRPFWRVFLELNRLVADFAQANQIDGLVIATHPRHARFYQRMMGFKQIGGITAFPTVRNSPAVACCMEFRQVHRQRPPCYDAIFGGQPDPRTWLGAEPISTDDRNHFRKVASAVEHWIPFDAPS